MAGHVFAPGADATAGFERTPRQQVADDYTDAIAAFCYSLTVFPLRGTRRDDLRPGLRVTNYRKRTVIAFAADAQAERVAILGIFHGGQDYETALEESAS